MRRNAVPLKALSPLLTFTSTMASTSSSLFLIFFSLLFFLSSPTTAAAPPRGILLPATRYSTYSVQYVTQLHHKTPLRPVNLTVDLGGRLLWLFCDDYVSSTYQTPPCGSPQCKLAGAADCLECPGIASVPSCVNARNNTCTVTARDWREDRGVAQIAQDVVAGRSTSGSGLVLTPQIVFGCGCSCSDLAERYPEWLRGGAGLGRTHVALPAQLSKSFGFPPKFALCLSPSKSGFISFGNGPRIPDPNITYTPMVKNHDYPAEYYIAVKSIKINGENVKFNSTALPLDRQGGGGGGIFARLTTDPFTHLEQSIYDAVSKAFDEAFKIKGARSAEPVNLWQLCYDAKSINFTNAEPVAPHIDFVLQNENIYWRISGSNALVKVTDNMYCLAFTDIANPKTPILFGLQQLEDNYFEFDTENLRIGISSSRQNCDAIKGGMFE